MVSNGFSSHYVAALQLIEFPAGAHLSQFYEANNSSAEEMCAVCTSFHTNRTGRISALWQNETGPIQREFKEQSWWLTPGERATLQ